MLTKEQAVPGTIFYLTTYTGRYFYLITKIDNSRKVMDCIPFASTYDDDSLNTSANIQMFSDQWFYCCTASDITTAINKRLGGVDESD